MKSSIANFTVKTSEFYQGNELLVKSLCLRGTIVCNYEGNRYDIPIEIFLREHYLNVASLVYVRPTPTNLSHCLSWC